MFEGEQIKNAKTIIKPFLLSRIKTEILKDLPPKSVDVIMCPMVEKQLEMYRELVLKFSTGVNENQEPNYIAMMMQLRKLSNHPLLLQNYYEEDKLWVRI